MKSYFRPVLVFLAVMSMVSAGFPADASSLKPPPGAKVAIQMFEDLECPDCARAYPVVWEAARAHGIPVVLHDFPLPKHNWSFDAAIFARFFDTKSEKLGNDFRGYIYQNQVQVTLRIAPDCRLGEYPMRLRTATGISEMHTFYVGALPNISEKEPNSAECIE